MSRATLDDYYKSAAGQEETSKGPRTYRNVELVLILIAVVVAGGAYALVGIGASDAIPANVYSYTGILAAFGIGINIVLRIRAKYADPILVPTAIMLNGLGLAMIFRIGVAKDSTRAADSQLIWMGLGVILCATVIFVLRDHRALRNWPYVAFLAGVFFLLLPLVPGLGRTINGSRIWIGLGPFSFQPGEIAKILLAIFFAGYFVNYRDQLRLAGPRFLGMRLPRLRDTGPLIIAWIIAVAVMVFQTDLGSALLFFGLFVAMLYVATGIKTWIVLGLSMFGAAAVSAYFLFSHFSLRVDAWLNALSPEEFNRTPGGSYQLVQGMFGMANGGLFGTGFGEGRPQIVPYSDSDFIISSFGEEIGMIGLFAILMLYLIMFQRGVKIAGNLRDHFGTLLSLGLSFLMAFQTFIVVGGVTRLIPLTGLTTPYLAAGGSSLVANWIILGLLLRMSDNARRPQEEFQTGVLQAVTDTSPKVRTDKEPEVVDYVTTDYNPNTSGYAPRQAGGELQ
ncbi:MULTISPECIES: FtsW/RodA/SpoVE family cell cycle protein [unclassified Brevibacterium]|uniref:FtsW/RodA/SpoVE family cell cycle protein n=1 Tax=unclassified Brevibacterium TaxID=2614124 RepID=UPI0008A4C74B|nr:MULTISPECIES: FtsW/RodA/SpoVE family cell cycle protein [unclassified Brevibacterium]OFL67648.1 cell division protein [Brevibacterium sp. HMSC063G07]OFS26064.1 cell division protein [Brevibacterium sp. HMSC07C04]